MYIRLAFQKKTKSFNLFAWLVKVWTNSPYFHVEIVINDQWISSDSVMGGVYTRQLKPFNDSWDYVNIEVEDKHTPDVWDFVSEEIGSKYDWCGVLCVHILGVRKHNKNKWFCSEMVGTILKMYKHPYFDDINPILLTPGDIYDIVTQGILNEV